MDIKDKKGVQGRLGSLAGQIQGWKEFGKQNGAKRSKGEKKTTF